jgi:hypothetical protein
MVTRIINSLVVVALLALAPVAKADFLKAVYDPDNGNMTLQAVNAGGDPTTLNVKAFVFLSPTQQFTGEVANLPPRVGAGSLIETLNDADTFGFYGTYSEISSILATAVSSTSRLGMGSPTEWDLGNVAAPGLSLSNFTAAENVTPGSGSAEASFAYLVVGEQFYRRGDVTAVPEPSTLAMGGIAGLFATAGFVRTRNGRRKAGRIAA